MDPSVACLIAQIRHADHQFKKAISQLTLLNNKISSTRCRYNRARREDRKTFAQKTSLQLTTYEGVRKMYFEYAGRKCEEIQQLCDVLWEIAGLEYEDIIQEDSQENDFKLQLLSSDHKLNQGPYQDCKSSQENKP
jgi:hypothetical protein